MSARQYLRELKISLLHNIEVVDQALALIPEGDESDESSGESNYESVDEEEQYIPPPPSLVRQDGEYPPIELSDGEEHKLEEPIPLTRYAADGTRVYKRYNYD